MRIQEWSQYDIVGSSLASSLPMAPTLGLGSSFASPAAWLPYLGSDDTEQVILQGVGY